LARLREPAHAGGGDLDGVLDLDDLPEGDPLRRLNLSDRAMPASGADGLVGRPLADVERYYIERALERTEGNREEAAKLLGIGERTLYRVIQEWKLQDRIKHALTDTVWDMSAAAGQLGMKATTLERKVKKWGWQRPE